MAPNANAGAHELFAAPPVRLSYALPPAGLQDQAVVWQSHTNKAHVQRQPAAWDPPPRLHIAPLGAQPRNSNMRRSRAKQGQRQQLNEA